MQLLTPVFPNVDLATILGSPLVQYFCSKIHAVAQGQQLPESVKLEFQLFDWSVNWDNNARANMQSSPAR